MNVKTSKRVPLNATADLWIFCKKCPWTQKNARENRPKNDVHGNFWGSCYKTVCIIFLYCIVLQTYVHTIDIHTYNTLFWIILFCIYYIQIVLYSILYCIYKKILHTYILYFTALYTYSINFIHTYCIV